MRILLLVLAGLTSSVHASEPGTASRNADLLAAPAPGAAVAGKVKDGQSVTLIQRQGMWYQASTPEKAQGWLPLFDVRLASEPVRRPPQVRTTTRTAVMGVRGLDEVALEEAKPDEAQLAQLEKNAAKASDLLGFERSGKSVLHPVMVLWRDPPPPPPSKDGKPAPDPKASEVMEKAMGDQVAAAILGAAPLVKNAKMQRYVNLVGLWVSRESDRPTLDWRFGVIDSDSVNAFAVPGGAVLVTRGLYKRMGSEAELAGVLAHEIAHIEARHHYMAMLQSRAMQEVQERLGKVKFAKAGIKAMLSHFITKGAGIMAHALDQKLESQADQRGMLMASDAGYDPYGLPRVMQELGAIAVNNPKDELLFRTHPMPEDRLRALQEFSQSNVGSRQGPDMAQRFSTGGG
jgi:hypothetical protein